MTRDQAVILWRQWNSDESLWRHALSVEAVMRRFARKYREDEEFFSIEDIMNVSGIGEKKDEKIKKDICV